MVTLRQDGIDDSLGIAFPRIKPRPTPSRYAAWQRALLLVNDIAVFFASALLALVVTKTPLAAVLARADVVLALFFAAAIAFLIYERVGLYRHSVGGSTRDEIYSSLAASVLRLLPPAALLILLPSLAPFRHQLAVAVAFSAAGISLTRLGLRVLRDHITPPRSRRIAVAGTPARVEALPSQLSLTGRDSILRLPLEEFDEEVNEVAINGNVEQLSWLEHATNWNCDTLIVTEALPTSVMPALLRAIEARGIELAFAPMRIKPHACDFRVRRDGGLALLYPQSLAVTTPGADFLRRVFDLMITIPALVAVTPLLIAIALAIAVDSGRPIFFRQRRVGRYGKEFDVLKFRTMRNDAEDETGPQWAKAGESRVTRLGRWLRRTSFDELPQLINVLRGDMSLVGPRPERPYYVERFRAIVPRYDERHLVRPGITGWAQINMRRILEPKEVGEKLSYDLFYLEHWSIFLDATIFLKTLAEFLFQKAA